MAPSIFLKFTLPTTQHVNFYLTGLRPYACATCNKSFNCRSSLRNHRYLHNEVRPHTCSICQKGFSKPSYLAKHRVGCLKRNKNTGKVPNNTPEVCDVLLFCACVWVQVFVVVNPFLVVVGFVFVVYLFLLDFHVHNWKFN